jgi:transposase
MSLEMLSRHLLLPNLLLKEVPKTLRTRAFNCYPVDLQTSCPSCGDAKTYVHQRTIRKVKDAMSTFESSTCTLNIHSTRYRCRNCKKTFTPKIPGIDPRARCTERLRRKILWSCDNFADLKKVRTYYKIGNASIYNHYFKALNLKIKHRENKPWPKRLGVDEHGFNKNKKLSIRNFVTMFVDHNYKRPFELLPCRDKSTLIQMTNHIPGRENVEIVSMDLSSTYRSYVREMFPQAMIIADPFHVVKLIHPALNKYRYQITDKNRKHPLRKLLLKKRANIDWSDRIRIEEWLQHYPHVKEIYLAKEKLHTLYQTKGYDRAKIGMENLIKTLEKTNVKELKTLRRTLISWREEILNYFKKRVSNARVEGFNNVAKSIIKRSYGLTNFANYRLRVLNV